MNFSFLPCRMIFSLFFMVVIGGIFAFCRNPLVPFWNKKLFGPDTRRNSTTA